MVLRGSTLADSAGDEESSDSALRSDKSIACMDCDVVVPKMSQTYGTSAGSADDGCCSKCSSNAMRREQQSQAQETKGHIARNRFSETHPTSSISYAPAVS